MLFKKKPQPAIHRLTIAPNTRFPFEFLTVGGTYHDAEIVAIEDLGAVYAVYVDLDDTPQIAVEINCDIVLAADYIQWRPTKK